MIANANNVEFLAVQYWLLINYFLMKKSLQSECHITEANNVADFILYIYLDLTHFLLSWLRFILERGTNLVFIFRITRIV